jgi:hypothetical protein
MRFDLISVLIFSSAAMAYPQRYKDFIEVEKLKKYLEATKLAKSGAPPSR